MPDARGGRESAPVVPQGAPELAAAAEAQRQAQLVRAYLAGYAQAVDDAREVLGIPSRSRQPVARRWRWLSPRGPRA